MSTSGRYDSGVTARIIFVLIIKSWECDELLG